LNALAGVAGSLAGLAHLWLVLVAATGGFDWVFVKSHSSLRLGAAALALHGLRTAFGGRTGWPARRATALGACAALLLAVWEPLELGALPRMAGNPAALAVAVLGLAAVLFDASRSGGPGQSLRAPFLRLVRPVLLIALLAAVGGAVYLFVDARSYRKELAEPPLRFVDAEPQARDGVRLLLVGLDGANWDVARPLLERGELPNLARLIANGHSGPLQSLRTWRPTVKRWGWWSAVVWNSVATGYDETRHGVLDFEMPAEDGNWSGPLEPAARKHWTARPFWELLAEHGVPTSIGGWWNTFPTRPFEGELATLSLGLRLSAGADPTRVFADMLEDPKRAEHYLYPHTLLAERGAALRLPGSEAELDAFLRDELLDLERNEGTEVEAEATFRGMVWQDLLFKELARTALTGGKHRMVSWYCEGTDTAQHHYWQFRTDSPAALAARGEEPERLRDLVDNYYRLADRWLGELLQAAGPDWNVLVVSDHGHGPSTHNLRRRSDHRGVGLYVASGPDFRQDTWPQIPWLQRLGLARGEPSILDVAPTLLYLFGVPLAADFDGDVRTGWIRPETLAELPAFRTPSYRYERGTLDLDLSGAAAHAAAHHERLVALGYVDGGDAAPGPDPQKEKGDRE